MIACANTELVIANAAPVATIARNARVVFVTLFILIPLTWFATSGYFTPILIAGSLKFAVVFSQI